MKIQKILTLLFLFKINTIFGITTTTDTIAALVNHQIILDSDIKKNLNIIKSCIPKTDQYLFKKTLSYQDMLNQLIIKTLIFEAANQEKTLIESYQIDQTINDILYLKNITLNQFQKNLNQIGINYKQYYTQIYQEMTNNIICKKIVYQRAHISPDSINELAQELNAIDYNTEFKIIHIILPLPIKATQDQIMIAKNLAKSIIKKNEKKENIVELINTYNSNKSIFQTIKMQQTQWISWKNIPTIFDQYLQTTKINKIIGPIYSYDGIHILKIQDIRYKKFIFPITKIKMKILILKNPINQNNAIENLLKIKKYIENNNTTFNMIARSKLKNSCNMCYKEYLQWDDLENFEPEIKKALINLRKKEISMPIYTSFGWCLIQLIDTNTLNYSEMKRERAYHYLLDQKFNTIIDDWIQELKSISYIKIIN